LNEGFSTTSSRRTRLQLSAASQIRRAQADPHQCKRGWLGDSGDGTVERDVVDPQFTTKRVKLSSTIAA
jgi:hypothetical protein